jgi:polyisoprenoid-binding protein YceI
MILEQSNLWRTIRMSTTELQATSLPTGTWTADVVHSSVTFEVPYMGVASFSGAVADFKATLADGRLSGAARIASLETKDENLQAHLLSPEFFDAERHPEVTFSGTPVARDGGAVEFEGELTIRGVTRPATLTGTIVGPVADPYGNERYGLRLETTIDRTAFGIVWNAPMPDGSNALADEVTLEADLSLLRAG